MDAGERTALTNIKCIYKTRTVTPRSLRKRQRLCQHSTHSNGECVCVCEIWKDAMKRGQKGLRAPRFMTLATRCQASRIKN